MKNLNKEYNIKELIKNNCQLRKENICIGFTNGCFDLLHKGHIYQFLKQKKNVII